MRILHISDLHLPVPHRTWRGADFVHPKRFLGGLNLLLRRETAFANGLHNVRALAELATREKVDAVLCTGDVSSLGVVAEMEQCVAALAPLRQASSLFICTPGNHDLYIDRKAYQAHLAPLCGQTWPRVIEQPDCTVIVLNSTKPNPHLFSTGRLGAEQLAGLRDALVNATGRVLIATHHGPFLENGQPDKRTHGYVDHRAFIDVLRTRPEATALCHGHIHHTYHLNPEGLPEIYCAGSATQAGREGAWLFDITPDTFTARQLKWSNNDFTNA